MMVFIWTLACAAARLCAGALFAESGDLTKLKNMRGGSGSEAGGAPRERAQKEAAYSQAIQLGARSRYQEILDSVVRPAEKRLDAVFDFKALLIRQGGVTVLPPVLGEAGAALRVDGGGRSAEYQDASFFMVSKAKIVSGPPDWRHYLYLDLKAPDAVPESLRPQSATESSKWKERVVAGWEIGTEQADVLFRSQVAKLTRDYAGLLLYEELKGAKRVEPPRLAETGAAEVKSESELVYGRRRYELLFEGSFEKSKRGAGK